MGVAIAEPKPLLRDNVWIPVHIECFFNKGLHHGLLYPRPFVVGGMVELTLVNVAVASSLILEGAVTQWNFAVRKLVEIGHGHCNGGSVPDSSHIFCVLPSLVWGFVHILINQRRSITLGGITEDAVGLSSLHNRPLMELEVLVE